MNVILGLIALLLVTGFAVAMVKLFFAVNYPVLVVVILLLLFWGGRRR